MVIFCTSFGANTRNCGLRVLFSKTVVDKVSFFDLEKVYPKLKKNKDYLTLKEKATTIRERMIYSFDDYNKKVREYNAMDEIEIYSRIKKIARFPKYDCYK